MLYTKSGAWKNSSPGFQFLYTKRQISNIIVEVKTHSSLSEHLCFDEIKSTKDSKNGMSFVFLDARTHDFIDIVDGRTQHILKQYFMRYPRKVRKKVKTICIDIYPPYMNMI